MPNFNILVLLSLTHVIANRVKYISRAVMTELLTHLTKNVGVPGSSLSGSPLSSSTPGC